MRIDPSHPVALLFGVQRERGRPVVYVHKYALYEKLGPGVHPCHWCGSELQWRRGTAEGSLLVDHLDGNKANNDPANLVPACNGCNTIRDRGHFRAAITDGELHVVARDGARTRAGQLECEICGKQFVATVARIKRKTAKTCSKACAGIKGRRVRWGH